jgi:hypothetical protein
VVVKKVQNSRRRIWIEAQTLQFSSFSELNVWLAQCCRRYEVNCVTRSMRR